MAAPTGNQQIVVLIQQVDIPNRIAHVTDKTGAPIQVSWRQSPAGALHIPSAGEKWVASRIGGTLGGIWNLDSKLDSMDDHQWVKDNMQPGDTRLSAAGTLHMTTNQAMMNGRGIAPTLRDQFDSDTAFTVITLNSLVSTEESIHILLNGLTCSSSLWVFDANDNTITFIPDMASGQMVVYYQSWVLQMDDF